MSTQAEHPLETLYQVRDELETAVATVQQQTSEQISDELCSYAAVNTATLYAFRTLVCVLTGKLDTSRPPVHAAHGEMSELITMLDQMIAHVDHHQSTIAELSKRDGATSLR